MKSHPKNCWAVYNGKAVEMDHLPPNEQFRRACQRIIDNQSAGHVITPRGLVYFVSREFRMAKLVTGDHIQPIMDRWRLLSTPDNFALANDPTPHRPAQFENAEQRRQRVLVEGMGCLPGQLDLF
jgi:hypothetical protein